MRPIPERGPINRQFPQFRDGRHRVNLGNGSLYDIVVHLDKECVTVGVCGRGCAGFPSPPNWHMVNESLGLNSESDARHFADMIADQFEFGYDRQGIYQH